MHMLIGKAQTSMHMHILVHSVQCIMQSALTMYLQGLAILHNFEIGMNLC